MVLYDEKFGYGGESFGSSESNTSGTTGTDTQSFSDGPEAVETTVDAGAANASAGNDDAVKTSVADPFKEEQFANKTRIFGNDAEAAASSDFTDDKVRKAAQEYVVNSESGSNGNTGYGGSYGTANYSGGNYGGGSVPPTGGGFGGGYVPPETPSGGKKAKPKKQPKYVTWKAFIIVLIICMLATSGLTVGGLKISGALNGGGETTGSTDSSTNSSSGKEVSATNYTLTKSTRSDKSIQEIVALNENAVVEIRTESISTDSWMQNYVKEGAGSGVIIQSDGYIMTCNHVIDGASNIKVALKDGTEYDATVIGADDVTDIAVLKIDATGLTAVTYGNSDDIQVGDMAVAIGNPLGKLGGTATAGIISSLNREIEVDGKIMNLLQTDTSINPGNSGGGLFDGSGNLVGIVIAKSSGSDVEGLGFAIPINTAAPIAAELIQNGKITGRAAIGVTVLDLTSAEKAMQYGVRMTGIYISEITSDEAKDAGFQVGDLIYYVEDTEITSAATLRSILAEYKPGDKIKVTVIRDNETIELETTLVESN